MSKPTNKITKTILKRASDTSVPKVDPPTKKRPPQLHEEMDDYDHQDDKNLFDVTETEKDRLNKYLQEIRKEQKDGKKAKQGTKSVEKSKEKRRSVVFNDDRNVSVEYDVDKKWNTAIENEKKGTFSEEERETLYQSICKFAYQNDLTIEDIQQQIFYNVNPHRKEAMWTTICSVLPRRSINSCFKFLKRSLDPKNHQGHWTPEEVDELKSLVEEHSRKWTKISKQLNRSAQNVKDKYMSLGEENNDERNILFWKMEELITFFRALEKELEVKFLDKHLDTKITNMEIHDRAELQQREGRKRNSQNFFFHNTSVLLNFINTKRLCESDPSGVSWSRVSRAIKTKSKDDCRNKWKQISNIVLNRQDSYTPREDKKLIASIEEQDVENEFEINFDVENNHTSRHNQARWNVLKKFVSGRVAKNVREVVREIKTKAFKNEESIPETEENKILKMFVEMKKVQQEG